MGMTINFVWGMLGVRFGFLVMVIILVGSLAVPGGRADAKSTRNLIRELAVEHSVSLNDDEIAVLRRALPIVGRRYLREVDPTRLLKETMVALRKYDSAMADAREKAKKSGKNDQTEVPVRTFRRMSLALNKGLNVLDAHSAYLDPESYGELRIRISGKFAGLGLEVTMDDGLVKVIAPIDDTPAQRAGMQAGDKISHVDGAPIKGMTLREAVSRMRGLVGTTIRLTVIRPEVKEPFEVLIVRATIRIPAVRHTVEKDYGYIRVSGFSRRTKSGLRKAIRKIDAALGAASLGLVVDLRNNPGGLLRQAIQVSDVFLDRGTIVSVRGRMEEDNDSFPAHGGDLTSGRTVVLLMNEGTASAAEIVAGSLKENDRAILVGSRSFGKGSVQTIFPMDDSGALRLTTALYYTPSGRTIQAWGILPHLHVEHDRQKSARREEQLEGALNRGEGVPPAVGPKASVTGAQCNELLTERIDDADRACAVAVLRVGGLDHMIHLASSLVDSDDRKTQRQ